MKFKVCLIVDNPLRDLEGLTLVAWHLAQKDIVCYIVPMYCQAFDVIALKPDIVIVNYLRPNNVNLLLRYKKENIKVCILDTEGSPGRDLSKFANFIFQIKERDLVDIYCLWGIDQYNVFKKQKLFDETKLKITGCPRYDFCTHPYNKTFPQVFNKQKFILINTTFPVGNPKFTSNFRVEEKAMVNMGYDRNFAKNYARDSYETNRKLIRILQKTCEQFPELDFVLRPHPFESTKPYEVLLKKSNFHIIQTKTAIEWLNCCEALLHLNCQTAIEAVMIGVEPISIEWINTPYLKIQGPPGDISHNANNFTELATYLNKIISQSKLKPSMKMIKERKNLIASRLFRNDGLSSFRVSQFIYEFLETNTINSYKIYNYSFNYKQVARELLGFKMFHFLRKIIQGKKSEFRRNEKSFNVEEVKQIINRLNKIISTKKIVRVNKVFKSELQIKKMFSKKTIKIST